MVTLLWVAGLLVAPLQDPEPRLRARLDPATARAVEEVLDAARAKTLPTEPLVQKALEGQTKGAPSARIVAAVEALLRGLDEARQALGASAGADELQAGALWLRSGGSSEQLSRMRRAAPNRSLAVPIAVSSELLARGWPALEAGPALERLLEARVSDAAFLSLRAGVDAAVKGGGSLVPAVTAEVTRLAGRRP